MTFDSDRYWVDRGRTYREEFEAKPLRKKIPYWVQEYYIKVALEWISRISEVERILDMGCGFGRITAILCRKFPFAVIAGMDISGDQLNEARRTMGGRVAFYKDSITDFGYTWDNDIITVIEVLMHIPRDKIARAIETLKLACFGYVITVDWWTEDAVDIWAGESTGYQFMHDYEKLFEAQGFELFSEKKIPFVAQKLRMWRLLE